MPNPGRLAAQPLLLVADGTLKDAAVALLARHGIGNVTVIHDPVDRFSRPAFETKQARNGRRSALAAAKAEAHAIITSRRWDVLISLYQEFLFLPAHLGQTGLPLNIHPSTETIPGMGYDVLPLVPGSATFGAQGATLHFMNEKIDDGLIVRVVAERVADGATYPVVRRRNQQLCMEQLAWLVERITECGNAGELESTLRGHAAREPRRWGTYVDAKQRDAMLFALHCDDPHHPALVGNAKFAKALQWRAERQAAPAEEAPSEPHLQTPA